MHSVAVTDGTAGDNKVINLCSLFFTSAQTKFFLYDGSKGQSPGVPYRDNTASGWCNPSKKSNFFATAGILSVALPPLPPPLKKKGRKEEGV